MAELDSAQLVIKRLFHQSSARERSHERQRWADKSSVWEGELLDAWSDGKWHVWAGELSSATHSPAQKHKSAAPARKQSLDNFQSQPFRCLRLCTLPFLFLKACVITCAICLSRTYTLASNAIDTAAAFRHPRRKCVPVAEHIGYRSTFDWH